MWTVGWGGAEKPLAAAAPGKGGRQRPREPRPWQPDPDLDVSAAGTAGRELRPRDPCEP